MLKTNSEYTIQNLRNTINVSIRTSDSRLPVSQLCLEKFLFILHVFACVYLFQQIHSS